MGNEHAFPLLVEMPNGHYRLIEISHGTVAVPMGDPVPPAYDPAVKPAPRVEGRPVEGDPIAGRPTWAAARAQARDPEPTSGFVSVKHSIGGGWIGPARVTQFEWNAQYADPPNRDRRFAYTETHYTLDLPSNPVSTSRSSSSAGRAAESTVPCEAPELTPLWDAARFSFSLELLDELWDLMLICGPDGAFRFQIAGPPAAGPWPSTVDLDAETGFLHSAWFRAQS